MTIEEAAKQYADYEVGERSIDKNVHDPDFVEAYQREWKRVYNAFLAGYAEPGTGAIWEVLQLSEGVDINSGVRIATTTTGALSQHICDWLNVEPQKPKEIYYIPRVINPPIPLTK